MIRSFEFRGHRPRAAHLLGAVLLTAGGLAGGSSILMGQEPMERSGPSLSLEEAFDLAHRNNPEFRMQESQLGPADWRVREAYGSLVPTANLSNSMGYTASGERRFSSVVLGEQPGILSSSYSLGFSLSLSGTSLLRPSAARAQRNATGARVEGASAGLAEEVTQAYLAVLEADAEVEQALTQLERTRSQVRQARAQAEVGTGTSLDVRRAEVQEGQAEVQLLQAENLTVTTRLALARVLGVELSRQVELSTEFELFDPDLDIGRLLDRALARNPVLRANRAQAEAASTQVRMARSQYLPSVSLSAGLQGSVFEPTTLGPLVDDRLRQMQGQFEGCLQENRIRELLDDPARDCAPLDPARTEVETRVRQQLRAQNTGFPFDFDSQPASLSLTISLPIFQGLSRQLQVEEARVAHSNVREEVRAQELRLRSEVESAVRSVRTAHRTVELQGRIRETAAEELRLARERFRLGVAGSIEVVDAQTNLSEAERDEITAIYDFHRAFATLEALVGESLR